MMWFYIFTNSGKLCSNWHTFVCPWPSALFLRNFEFLFYRFRKKLATTNLKIRLVRKYELHLLFDPTNWKSALFYPQRTCSLPLSRLPQVLYIYGFSPPRSKKSGKSKKLWCFVLFQLRVQLDYGFRFTLQGCWKIVNDLSPKSRWQISCWRTSDTPVIILCTLLSFGLHGVWNIFVLHTGRWTNVHTCFHCYAAFGLFTFYTSCCSYFTMLCRKEAHFVYFQ